MMLTTAAITTSHPAFITTDSTTICGQRLSSLLSCLSMYSRCRTFAAITCKLFVSGHCPKRASSPHLDVHNIKCHQMMDGDAGGEAAKLNLIASHEVRKAYSVCGAIWSTPTPPSRGSQSAPVTRSWLSRAIRGTMWILLRHGGVRCVQGRVGGRLRAPSPVCSIIYLQDVVAARWHSRALESSWLQDVSWRWVDVNNRRRKFSGCYCLSFILTRMLCYCNATSFVAASPVPEVAGLSTSCVRKELA